MIVIDLKLYTPTNEVLFAFDNYIRQFVTDQAFNTLEIFVSDPQVLSSGIQEFVCVVSTKKHLTLCRCAQESLPYFGIGAVHVLALIIICFVLTSGHRGKQTLPYVVMAICAVLLPIISTAG